MAKANWNEYDATAANNTVVDDIDISEGCAPSTINNALRELMAHTADVVAGTTALSRLIVDNIDINGTTIGHTSDTDLLTLTSGNLAVAGDVTTTGGIELGNASDTTLARASAGNITVEGNAIYRAGGTDVPVADGGTGASTHTANNILVGAGASAITSIAPSTTGNVLTSQADGTWASAAAAGGGKILQVLTASKTDTFSNSTSSFTDVTGLSIAITPANTSNTILIIAQMSVGAGPSTVDNAMWLRLLRDSTDILQGDASGSRTRVTTLMTEASTYSGQGTGISFVDSPSTTSAVTYKIQIQPSNGGDAYINRSHGDLNASTIWRGGSSITVMEIDGT